MSLSQRPQLFTIIIQMCLIILINGQRHNILLLMMDDFRPAIKALGDVNAVTPNIDRLVASSHVFENAYAQVSLRFFNITLIYVHCTL